MFAGKKSAQIREILISESAWEEMTCLFAPSLGMFSLPELQGILELRKAGQPIDVAKHNEYIKTLGYVARTFDLSIPKHWF